MVHTLHDDANARVSPPVEIGPSGQSMALELLIGDRANADNIREWRAGRITGLNVGPSYSKLVGNSDLKASFVGAVRSVTSTKGQVIMPAYVQELEKLEKAQKASSIANYGL